MNPLGRFVMICFALVAVGACSESTKSGTPSDGGETSAHNPTAIVRSTELPRPASAIAPVVWDVYDPNPQHLWNRLFRIFYARTSKDGKEYGRDSLDLLQWDGTSNFLTPSSYSTAVQLLDEFLLTHSETLITNQLKRALFQRDLWAVFDWISSETDNYPDQRLALEERLVEVLRRLALTKSEIETLPDNYQVATDSQAFPANYDEAHPATAFLPVGFFAPKSDWLTVGRQGGPNAMLHVDDPHFLGRSAFLVLIRAPRGRAATLDLLPKLQHGQIADMTGIEVALVRRMLLVDQQGDIVASPLIESIQFRHFYPYSGQMFYEFNLDRDRLFAGNFGGLRPLARDETGFPLFLFSGINFAENSAAEIETHFRTTLLSFCTNCHGHNGRSGSRSIISVFRDSDFPLPDNQEPALVATTPVDEIQATIGWKQAHDSWKVLQARWQRTNP